MKISYKGKKTPFNPEGIKTIMDAFDNLLHLMASMSYPEQCEDNAAVTIIDTAKVKQWYIEAIANTDEYSQYVNDEQERINQWCEGKIKDKLSTNPRWELHTHDGRTYHKNPDTGDWEITEGIEIE